MSALEDLLAEQLTREGIEFYREYKFMYDLPKEERRQFRADFAIPAIKCLVEIQGGIYLDKSGHKSISGLKRDYEKSNLSQLHGWRYLQFTADDVSDGKAVDMVIRFSEAMR